MAEKYVGYLDILGFKSWLNSNDVYEAKDYFNSYSDAFHETWNRCKTNGIHCIMVSDCAVIYSDDVEKEKLKNLINVAVEISIDLFQKTSILIRGAICKGDFEMLKNAGDSNIEERLFTGKAYVEAFKLEEEAKIAGIALDENVSRDIGKHIKELETRITKQEDVIKAKKYTLIRYFSYDYLLEDNHLDKFVNLMIESNWLPHYYNTIYSVLYRADHKEIFEHIIRIIENKDKNGELFKAFIRGAYSVEVDKQLGNQLSSFIRNKIVKGES